MRILLSLMDMQRQRLNFEEKDNKMITRIRENQIKALIYAALFLVMTVMTIFSA